MLDVVIGLIFVFFVLSIVCSAFNEMIASALKLRAKNLEQGLRSLLEDPGVPGSLATFLDSPRIQALMEPGTGRLPSYIPPRAFALTVLDTFAPPGEQDSQAQQRDLVRRARSAVEKMGGTPLADTAIGLALKDAVEEAGEDRDKLRAAIERSFNEVMERAAGWYKRRVQWILIGLATVIVCVANVDTLTIAQRLWKDDALRAAVVTQAAKQTSSSTCGDKAATSDPADRAAACVDGIEQLGLPLGWGADRTFRGKPETIAGNVVGKLLGLLITVGAVSLGAPFWFDLLGKVSRLRSTGEPPAPAPAGKSDPPAAAAT